MDTNKENIDHLRSYILKLTDLDIYEVEELALTSAQKARIGSWCEENDIEIPDLSDRSFWKKGTLRSQPSPELRRNVNALSQADLTNVSIGVDIQNILEFLPDISEVSKDSRELSSIFTKRELSYAESKKNPKETLAGIFAAKESIFKSRNIDIKNWIEIEILYDLGQPIFKDFTIGISHSKDYVVAVAISSQKPTHLNSIEETNINHDNHSGKQKFNFLNFLNRALILTGSVGGILFIFSYTFF